MTPKIKTDNLIHSKLDQKKLFLKQIKKNREKKIKKIKNEKFKDKNILLFEKN